MADADGGRAGGRMMMGVRTLAGSRIAPCLLSRLRPRAHLRARGRHSPPARLPFASAPHVAAAAADQGVRVARLQALPPGGERRAAHRGALLRVHDGGDARGEPRAHGVRHGVPRPRAQHEGAVRGLRRRPRAARHPAAPARHRARAGPDAPLGPVHRGEGGRAPEPALRLVVPERRRAHQCNLPSLAGAPGTQGRNRRRRARGGRRRRVLPLRRRRPRDRALDCGPAARLQARPDARRKSDGQHPAARLREEQDRAAQPARLGHARQGAAAGLRLHLRLVRGRLARDRVPEGAAAREAQAGHRRGRTDRDGGLQAAADDRHLQVRRAGGARAAQVAQERLPHRVEHHAGQRVPPRRVPHPPRHVAGRDGDWGLGMGWEALRAGVCICGIFSVVDLVLPLPFVLSLTRLSLVWIPDPDAPAYICRLYIVT